MLEENAENGAEKLRFLEAKMSQINTSSKQTSLKQQRLEISERAFWGEKAYVCHSFAHRAVNFDHPFVFLPIWSGLC